jgi:transcriptional regulator with XRE-family HTH domain
MQLREYLERENLTQHQFIDLCEMATGIYVPQGTLAKWILGVRIPRKKQMEMIYKITEGQVVPNDFYTLEE